MGRALDLKVNAALTPADLAAMMLGNVVARPTSNLPASTTQSLFAVTGGLVRLTSIVGVVTTVIETQACNTKLQAKATGQTAVDLCAVLDITAKAVDSLFTITGTAANAMVNGFAVAAMATSWVLRPGTIDLNCAATNTGQVRWIASYLPLETGAQIIAL